jgi:hypothetical protein
MVRGVLADLPTQEDALVHSHVLGACGLQGPGTSGVRPGEAGMAAVLVSPKVRLM